MRRRGSKAPWYTEAHVRCVVHNALALKPKRTHTHKLDTRTQTHTHTHTHTHNRSYNKFQACDNHAQKRHFEFGGDCAGWLRHDAFLANVIVLVFFGPLYQGSCRVRGCPWNCRFRKEGFQDLDTLRRVLAYIH